MCLLQGMIGSGVPVVYNQQLLPVGKLLIPLSHVPSQGKHCHILEMLQLILQLRRREVEDANVEKPHHLFRGESLHAEVSGVHCLNLRVCHCAMMTPGVAIVKQCVHK